jgi:hypothetical protein
MRDPTNEMSQGEIPHRQARVPSRNPARARRESTAVVSWGLRKRRRGGRRSVWRGKSRGVVGVVDYFQEWRRVAAGASSGGGELLLIEASMILWVNGQGKVMRMCARWRYRAGGQRGSAGTWDSSESSERAAGACGLRREIWAALRCDLKRGEGRMEREGYL